MKRIILVIKIRRLKRLKPIIKKGNISWKCRYDFHVPTWRLAKWCEHFFFFLARWNCLSVRLMVLFIFILSTETKISFISYSEDHLFRSEMLFTQEASMKVSGPIISAVVLGENITNSIQPVVVKIFPTKV